MRTYNESKNVYEAAQERIEFLFNRFERIYLSFSGGKDSGVMLNLVIDFMRKHGITKKIGVMTLDNEANYEHSMRFMHSVIEKNLDLLDVYWCCLPITLPCSVSQYAVDWQCWGERDKDLWIRPLPVQDYVVNFKNQRFPFFRENMNYQEFWDEFGEWYAQGYECACLIGIRTVESLNRFRAIMNQEKETMDAVVVIDKELGDRMASTIRHNRARGTHNIELMSVIVAELVEMGKGDRWICQHIGMSLDELLRLKQITGLASLFANKDFSASWESDGEDEENLAPLE